MTNEPLAQRTAVHGAMILLLVLAIFPVLWMILTSFKPENEVFSLLPWPRRPTLDNYAYVIGTMPIFRIIWNTVAMSGVTALLQVGALLAGLALEGYGTFSAEG